MLENLPAYVGRVPDYEVKDGQMHIKMGEFELVMPLAVFLRGAAKADVAIAKWHAEHPGDVVPMRKKRGH